MISYLEKQNKKAYCFLLKVKLGRIFSPEGKMSEGPHFLPGAQEGGKEEELRTLW